MKIVFHCGVYASDEQEEEKPLPAPGFFITMTPHVNKIICLQQRVF